MVNNKSKIIKELSIKHNLSIKEVTDIVNSQFKLLKQAMGNSNPQEIYFENLRLPAFGIFVVSERKKNRLRENKNKKKRE